MLGAIALAGRNSAEKEYLFEAPPLTASEGRLPPTIRSRARKKVLKEREENNLPSACVIATTSTGIRGGEKSISQRPIRGSLTTTHTNAVGARGFKSLQSGEICKLAKDGKCRPEPLA